MAQKKAQKKATKKVEKAVRKAIKKGLSERNLEELVVREIHRTKRKAAQKQAS